MKTLFNLLKLIPAFQKLLNEFFESERAELKKQIRYAENEASLYKRNADDFMAKWVELSLTVSDLRESVEMQKGIIAKRDAEIEELRNATTKKLQAVDDMDSESVFNTTLYSPRSTPRS